MTDHEIHEIPPPGSPLRAWADASVRMVEIEFALLVQQANAEASIARLLRGEDLADADVAALGRLNFAAFLQCYEPPVALLGPTRLDPRIADVLRGQSSA